MERDGHNGTVREDDLRHLCAELEGRLSAGERCCAEEVLSAHPELIGNADAALEVIYTEFVVREQLGQRPAPDEFRTRFPQWREGLEQLFEIHGAVGAGSVEDTAKGSGAPLSDRRRRHVHPASGVNGATPRIGNYELLGEVGRGGMGVVYKARQIGLNRLVALKMILTGTHAGPHERSRFRAEAEAAARLHHPNIVQIYEVGEHEGRPFLSLELVEGGSLEAMLTGTPWPATEAARLIEILSRAMDYAHQQRVVHRDLKPANVLLSKTSTDFTDFTDSKTITPLTESVKSVKSVDHLSPKIADFGLARRMASASDELRDRTALTAAGAILGTPAYMAPEQAAGDGMQIGPATDVHALGAILYELLTGRPPFQGVSLLETLDQVRTQEPVPPSRLLTGLPRDVDTICLKCLRKEPGHRYASAAALADDLARFQRGEPVHARPTPAWERTWKWAKRRPAVAALLASVVVLTIVGLTSITILWRQTAAALHTVEIKQNETEEALANKLVALAHRDWLANNVDEARRHLDECPPLHRGAEWRRLHHACNSCLFILGVPQTAGKVTALAWSPNGQYVATKPSGRPDQTVQVWDAATGRERFMFTGLAFFPGKLAFDSDNRLLAVRWPSRHLLANPKAPRKIEVKRWEMANGQELTGFETSLRMNSCAVSSDARTMAVAGDTGLIVIDLAGEPALRSMGHSSTPMHGLTLSPDGNRAAWWTDSNEVQLWDTVANMSVGTPIPAQDVRYLALSPKGDQIAIGGFESVRDAGIVKLWECRTGRELLTLRCHSNPITCVEFSPDGRRLATTSSDRTVTVWNLDTGKEEITLRGHSATIWTLAFSPDGTRLASGGSDGLVRIWDVRPFDQRTSP